MFWADCLVLFSGKDCFWKIGDFGLTTEGTSQNELQTKEARGTSCYRAPELLDQIPVFSNKVDIFALGCILFELVTWGRKAFTSDWQVHEYKNRDQLHLSFHGIDSDCWKSKFENEVYGMLAVDRTDRPSALTLQRRFAQNRWVAVGYECLQRMDYLNSITLFRLAVEEGVDEPSVWKALGDGCSAIENYSESAKAYEAAVDCGLTDVKLLTKLASVYYTLGEYDKAVTSFQSATAKDPDNPNLLMKLGDAYVSNRQYKDGIQTFRKALRKSRSSNNAMLLDKLSRALYANGDKGPALKINPNLTTVSTALIPRPRSSSPTLGSPSSPDTWRSRVIPPWLTRQRTGSLSIEIQVSTPPPNDIRAEFTADSSGTTSPGISRRSHVRKVKSAAPVSGVRETLSGTPLLFTAVSDASRTSHVSIGARRQHSAHITEVTDSHSGKTIMIGSKIAALESYSSQHFDEAFVSYGDVVQVEEIYEHGWVLGFKMSYKVWEEPGITTRESGGSVGVLESHREGEGMTQSSGSSSQKYLFEFSHFCHAEAWEEVVKPRYRTDRFRLKECHWNHHPTRYQPHRRAPRLRKTDCESSDISQSLPKESSLAPVLQIFSNTYH